MKNRVTSPTSWGFAADHVSAIGAFCFVSLGGRCCDLGGLPSRVDCVLPQLLYPAVSTKLYSFSQFVAAGDACNHYVLTFLTKHWTHYFVYRNASCNTSSNSPSSFIMVGVSVSI